MSPSGTGVKVFIHALKPGDRCRTGNTPWGGDIEMYDSGRFFTVTGNHLPGTPDKVCSRQGAFKKLYGRFFGDEPRGYDAPTVPGPLTDEELMAEAERISGDKFSKLFCGGDISAYGDDDSRARAALIGCVRWYAHDDPDQMERIMHRSNLDQSRFDEKRRGKPFIEYEIDRLTDEPLEATTRFRAAFQKANSFLFIGFGFTPSPRTVYL